MSKDIRTYADVITTVFDNLIEKGKENAWVACTRMEISDHAQSDDEDEIPSVGGFLTLACYAPSNYVSVMAAFSERPPYIRQLDQVDWTPVACHDSCWRSDGVESTIQSAYDQIRQAAEAIFGKPMRDLSPYLHLDDLKVFDEPRVLLRNGLVKDDKHQRLVLPFETIAKHALEVKAERDARAARKQAKKPKAA